MQGTGQWQTKGQQEHSPDLPTSPPHQSLKAEAVGHCYIPHHPTGWGTAPGSLRLSRRDSYPRVPTIVQPFLKLTADESPATVWPQRASLIKIPASSTWKPLWDLPQMKGEWEEFFCRAGLVFCHKAKQMFVKSELVIQPFKDHAAVHSEQLHHGEKHCSLSRDSYI